MADTTKSGVYQLENGMWGFRYTVTYNGKRKDVKRQKDELGRILKTEKAALRARESAMLHDKMSRIKKPVEKRIYKPLFYWNGRAAEPPASVFLFTF